MATRTDPFDLFGAPSLDSPTAAVPAVTPAVGELSSPPSAPLAADPGIDRAALASSPRLTPSPSPRPTVAPIDLEPVELADDPADDPLTGQTHDPAPAEWATENLSHLAAVLHSLACACAWGGDQEGHGCDFEDLAAAVREGVLAEATPAGKAPVEAKVSEGAWGTLAATLGLALVSLVLDRLDLLPSLVGGDRPWVGVLVLVLGVVLPPLASFLRGYAAPHTPRGDVS